jgi:hypothetical protein
LKSPSGKSLKFDMPSLTTLPCADVEDGAWYVALHFVVPDDGAAPDETVGCFNPDLAVIRAEAHSCRPGGVGVPASPDRRPWRGHRADVDKAMNS